VLPAPLFPSRNDVERDRSGLEAAAEAPMRGDYRAETLLAVVVARYGGCMRSKPFAEEPA
jgi:hypothetical protein